jgi:hypothetical protein
VPPAPKAIPVSTWTLIQAAIEQGARMLITRGYDAAEAIAGNADGSIDAEVRVRAIPHGVKVNEVLLDAEHALRDRLGPLMWISVGVRFPARPEEEKDEDFRKEYRVVRGLAEVYVHWQRHTKLADNFQTSRVITRRLRDVGRLKPEQVIIRIHWNPENRKPRRK